MTSPRPTAAVAGKRRVCVVGAGVVGLSTALRVLEQQQQRQPRRGEVEVTVVADRFSPNTTGDGSAGFWEPFALQDTSLSSIRKWSKATWDYLLHLATAPGMAAIVGAQLVSGYTLSDVPGDLDSPWKDIFMGFRQLTKEELQFCPRAKSGNFCTSLMVNVKLYLPWLMRRFKDAGGKVEFRTVHNLQELADDYDVIVNCCGHRAGALVSDPNTSPIRGQVSRAHAPWVKHFHIFESKDGSVSYLFPLGGVLIVGGLTQKGNWKEEADPKDTEDIWKRAVECFPFIKDCRKIDDWAGLRPGRTTVRLEADILTKDSKTVPVIHNYGHGGAGVTTHWGCAGDATSLVYAALDKRSNHSRL